MSLGVTSFRRRKISLENNLKSIKRIVKTQVCKVPSKSVQFSKEPRSLAKWYYG